MNKKDYIKKAIHWARKRGLSGIRADYTGFERPASFTKVDEDIPFAPDVTGNKSGRKCYIEIATKTDNVQQKVSKWKLLSILAKRKGGKLFLLAPRGHKAFTERILQRYNFKNAQLIYLPNM